MTTKGDFFDRFLNAMELEGVSVHIVTITNSAFFAKLIQNWYIPVHNVYFVKYDVTVSFLAQVLDTVTYFGGNHGSRV